MPIQFVLLPLFVEVLLTFVLLFWLAPLRRSAIMSGTLHPRDIALGQKAWPQRTQQIANSFDNQFQLPVLFYVLTILSIITHHADIVFLVLAWIFVLSRLVHAYVHTTSNRVMLRGGLYGVGAFALAIAWLIFIVRISPVCLEMTPGARLAAAIDVLAALEKERRPAADVLKGWGLAHRYAGSGDRAAIAGLVYDTLRRRASSAWIVGADTPRAIVLGMLKRERGMTAEAIAKLADGSKYSPEALSDEERTRLDAATLDGAPSHIAGDYPEWLDPHLTKSFGGSRAEEGAALASRAPLDLRVNTLKAIREDADEALSDLAPQETPWSPLGLRIALGADAKSPAVHAEPAFLKGLVEVQDEGSQLSALFSGAKAGEQVIDLCAGAGGKTLALAAMMENKGQLFATDDDKRRLAPIHDRLTRSGARNVQVRTPKSVGTELEDLKGRMDLVLIDSPCTGTGAWRRNPDAKWRIRPGSLEQRVKDQIEVLDRAVPLLKAGGRIAYITCSVLDEENGAQVRAFVARHPEFTVTPPAKVAGALSDRTGAFREAALMSEEGLLMTPRRTGTDGFFVSLLRHAG